MNEKIEFEAKVGVAPAGRLILSGFEPGVMSAMLNAKSIKTYRVTIEPVEPALKPCPFCGGEDLSVITVWGSGTGSGLQCAQCNNSDCGAKGSMKVGSAAAIQAWNRRGGDG